MAVSTKMAVFWVVAPSSLTTQCYDPEDSHLIPCLVGHELRWPRVVLH
jgi:hypothetical protein